MSPSAVWLELNDLNFKTHVVQSLEPIVVEIGADWSGSCHIMAPVLERLALEFAGEIKFGRMKIETSEQIAREFGVNQLPIILFFKDGNVLDHVVGTAGESTIRRKLKGLLDPGWLPQERRQTDEAIV